MTGLLAVADFAWAEPLTTVCVSRESARFKILRDADDAEEQAVMFCFRRVMEWVGFIMPGCEFFCCFKFAKKMPLKDLATMMSDQTEETPEMIELIEHPDVWKAFQTNLQKPRDCIGGGDREILRDRCAICADGLDMEDQLGSSVA